MTDYEGLTRNQLIERLFTAEQTLEHIMKNFSMKTIELAKLAEQSNNVVEYSRRLEIQLESLIQHNELLEEIIKGKEELIKEMENKMK